MVTVTYQGKRYACEVQVGDSGLVRRAGLVRGGVLLGKDGERMHRDQSLHQGEVEVMPVFSGG